MKRGEQNEIRQRERYEDDQGSATFRTLLGKVLKVFSPHEKARQCPLSSIEKGGGIGKSSVRMQKARQWAKVLKTDSAKKARNRLGGHLALVGLVIRTKWRRTRTEGHGKGNKHNSRVGAKTATEGLQLTWLIETRRNDKRQTRDRSLCEHRVRVIRSRMRQEI